MPRGPVDSVPHLGARGRVCLYQGDARPKRKRDNLVLYGWGRYLARDARNLRLGLDAYGLNCVYFEYENVASPGDRVDDAPTLDRTWSLDYFESLSLHGSRDYLRVPVSTIGTLTSDEDLFETFNGVLYGARTRSSAGVHGKPFSEAANSVVFGAFLVSMADEADDSQDIVAHGHYFDEDEQEPKYDLKPVAVDYEVTYE